LWTRRIGETSSLSVIAEDDEKIKRKRDHEKIHGSNARELHSSGYWKKRRWGIRGVL